VSQQEKHVAVGRARTRRFHHLYLRHFIISFVTLQHSTVGVSLSDFPLNIILLFIFEVGCIGFLCIFINVFLNNKELVVKVWPLHLLS